MTVLITLTLAGADVGPFDIYSNVDGFTTPVATGISRAALLAGYYATVPDGTTQVLVQSTGICTTQLYLTVDGGTTTTTTSSTTSTTTTPPTSGTLTISYNKFSSSFSMIASTAPGQSITVTGAITANGYLLSDCQGSVAGATLTGNLLTLVPGNPATSVPPTWTSGIWATSLVARITDVTIPISVNGATASLYSNGSILIVGPISYTVFIVSECTQ
jgi:hypothetical protein